MDLFSLLAKLTLDKTEYDTGMEDAQKTANELSVPEVKIPKTNNTEFDAGVKEAEETGSVFKEVMVGVWEGLKDAIAVSGVVGLVHSVVSYMKQGISLAISGGKEIADNSKNLQLSTKAYQEYEYILGKSNITMKELSKTMNTLDSIRGGDVSDDQAAYLEKLGYNVDELKSGAMSAEEMLTSLMGSVADYEGSDKGLIIDALFGKSDKWTGFFAQSTEDIEKLRQTANDMGLVMSDESVENAVKISDTMESISDKLGSIQRSFGEGILPLIDSAVDGLTRIIAFFTTDRRSLSELLSDKDSKFAEEIEGIETTAKTAETLADKLLEMGDTSKMTAEQYAIWEGTAKSLIGLVPSLGEVIDLESGQINANSQEIRENIKQWEELAKQKALQTLKEEKYQEIANKNKALIDKSIEANMKLAEAEGERTKSLDKINGILGEYGVEGLGENATMDDYLALYQKVTTENPFDSMLKARLTEAGSEWADANLAAEDAEAEVAALTEELEKGKQEYETWLSAAESMYGGLDSDAQSATTQAQELKKAIDEIPDYKRITLMEERLGFPNAIGNAYVPYDNYPALLHRGEKVLTATQARRDNGSVDFSGMEDRIIAAIAKGMENATVNAYLDGDRVTDDVSKKLASQLADRRYI